MKMKINVIRAGLLALVMMGATWSANGQDMRSLVREFAQLRADMRILQEDQKVLLDRITVLSQENVAKDAQIAELQKMLTMQETRIQGIEKDLIMRLEQLRKALESEQVSRRKDLETAVGSMAAEISKLDKVATNASAVANAASAAANVAASANTWTCPPPAAPAARLFGQLQGDRREARRHVERDRPGRRRADFHVATDQQLEERHDFRGAETEDTCRPEVTTGGDIVWNKKENDGTE